MGRLTATLLTILAVFGASSDALASSADQRKLDRSLSRYLRDAGGQTGAYVLDLKTGRPVFSSAASAGRLPASVEKLYTTSTALLRLGARARLTTRILGIGKQGPGGAWHGTLFLKGGGDPTFGSASFDHRQYGTGATLRQLVDNLVRRQRITSVSGHIVGDESYFDSLRGTPATGYQESSYVEGALSALAYNRGYEGSSFQSRPALYATQQLVSALGNAKVHVAAHVRVFTGRTPARAKTLAEVRSPRIDKLAELTNTPSDNYLAEMLAKGLGARFGGAGTTSAGARVIRSQLGTSFGIHPRLDDGSGLSRADRTSPRQVVKLLRDMAANNAFVHSLAVAGETGTMAYEMVGTRGQGNCRGKTGTLHDVASLVGYCTARNGHPLAFAFLMNSVDPGNGHALEDRMGEALADYRG
jgi:D-alanyl-D-alanine carboxypeptidase/D-alanyl-D-alanine-endopeptidase (penicillin-binding protein 4)